MPETLDPTIWSEPITQNEIDLMKAAAKGRNPTEMFRWLNYAVAIFEAQKAKSEDG